jgi:hypothetical protein
MDRRSEATIRLCLSTDLTETATAGTTGCTKANPALQLAPTAKYFYFLMSPQPRLLLYLTITRNTSRKMMTRTYSLLTTS